MLSVMTIDQLQKPKKAPVPHITVTTGTGGDIVILDEAGFGVQLSVVG